MGKNNLILVEIKAKCANPARIRSILKSKKAKFIGKDVQIDTYFNINKGRLKLREGKIENNLIFYSRENKKGPKKSKVMLYSTNKNPALKMILLKSLEKLVEVKKEREIYFIKNVKFHIDRVKSLGNFIEIEAIDRTGKIGKERLRNQVDVYTHLFKIEKLDLVKCSYSDLLLGK